MEKHEIEKRITEIEGLMSAPDFWSNKVTAQATVKEHQDLKNDLQGVGKYDVGPAILTILAGAGGDDAEDFSRMLLYMYQRYIENKGWGYHVVNSHPTDAGGYRSVTIEVTGSNAYGTLRHENGVHRLVRMSPFNANQKRHTSFSMVEVTPPVPELSNFELRPEDVKVEFSRAGGPGGQNVNKRETAVRIEHLPSGISVHANGERTQEANRDKAMQLLMGKIYKALEEARKENKEAMQISKTVGIEWGNQIRSYVLHPYKMVKDHRSGFEVRDVDRVLERGELDDLIESVRE